MSISDGATWERDFGWDEPPMRKLVIDERGSYVDYGSYRTVCEPIGFCLGGMLHRERLDIGELAYPLPQPPPGEPELPTLEAAANAVLMRENAELWREVEGLKGDVRQAEKHYEAASKRSEALRGQMDAVAKVLDGREPLFSPEQQGPVLELARKVVRQSRDRWILYEETMARLVQLGKDIELIRRESRQ